MKILTEVELKRIEYDTEVEHCFTDATQLRMGCCDIFAKALHDIFGYEMCRIDYTDSFHMFCRTVKHGRVIYIDASGMSYDFRDLQPTHDIDIDQIYSVPDVSIKGIHRSPDDEEYKELCEDEIIAYVFSRRLIRNHRDYYDVNYETDVDALQG